MVSNMSVSSGFLEISLPELELINGGSAWKIVGAVAAGVALGVAAVALVATGGAIVAACIAVSPAAASYCIGAAMSYAATTTTAASIGYGIAKRL